MRKAIVIIALLYLSKAGFSQGLLAVPGQSIMIANQATQISDAIQLLKQGEQTYATIKMQTQNIAQMNAFMQQTEENLKTLGNLKNLQISDILNIADKALPLKNTNLYPTQLKFV